MNTTRQFKVKNTTDSLTSEELNKKIVEGIISKIVYTSSDEGYSVIRVKSGDGKVLTATGTFSGAFTGQGIKIHGKWEKHPDYGMQFKSERFSFVLPATEDGIRRYLASGIIPGIGEKRAEMIVSHFGKDTIHILDNYSARLMEVSGFGKKTVQKIRKTWQEYTDKREIFIFFQGLGITPAYCHKIYKRFNNEALNIVKNNPYKLAEEVSGIGFTKADNIAKNIGINKNDNQRLRAGVLYSLKQLSLSGHVCYPKEKFIEYTGNILDVNLEDSTKGLYIASHDKLVSVENIPFPEADGQNTPFVYDTNYLTAEKRLAQIIGRLLSEKTHKGQAIKSQSNNHNILLNEEQNQAIFRVKKSPISIITGGPGVGKTTIIGELVRRATTANLKISLAAPTGRAAKRLAESTMKDSSTIHRLLKWAPMNQGFSFNENHQLPCDLLVVDEVSMLDMELALSLFLAIAPGTTVILIGDADQLPSVGAGNILADIIQSDICPVTRLTQIYRQRSNSKIIINAHIVNSGRLFDTTPQPKRQLSDFYWINQDDPQKTLDTILKLTSERIPKRFNLNPFKDIQILCPMNKGICGTKNLNEMIQKKINPSPKPQFEQGGRTLRTGDKVMQTVNNYDKLVFNGDIGRVANIDQKNELFTVSFESGDIQYEFIESDQLKLAYAITIHKSQGSEFPAVIVPVLTSHYIMLKRNLLYTAMTRAKQLLILIGSQKAMYMAIKNSKTEIRYSGFKHRINHTLF